MDALFKYKGVAIFAEFAQRDANNPVTFEVGNPNPRFVFKGYAGNLQLSYQTKAHHEVAFRWAHFSPDNEIKPYQATLNDYTLAYTKYVRFHRVKVHADITYRTAESAKLPTSDYLLYRFHIEMGI